MTIKPVADLYLITYEDGSPYKYTHEAGEAIDAIGAGFKVEEFVSLENHRASMLQDGNSPLTPDGWVMVPKEITPEMMRAVQIKSELGGYAASELSGAYDMFAEFWDVAVSAAPQQEVNP